MDGTKEARRLHRRAKRVARGLSQEQAAERSGLTVHRFRLVENDEQTATLADTERVAAALGYELAEYVGPDVPVAAEPSR